MRSSEAESEEPVRSRSCVELVAWNYLKSHVAFASHPPPSVSGPGSMENQEIEERIELHKATNTSLIFSLLGQVLKHFIFSVGQKVHESAFLLKNDL